MLLAAFHSFARVHLFTEEMLKAACVRLIVGTEASTKNSFCPPG